MMRAAAFVYLVALVLSNARAEPGIAMLIDNTSHAAEVGPLNGFVAVAEVGPPRRDIGEALEAWVRIKHSNDVSELEAIIARDKTTFLAKLARHRIEQLDSQRIHRPNVTPARLTPSN
jgi:hypothetical protein